MNNAPPGAPLSQVSLEISPAQMHESLWPPIERALCSPNAVTDDDIIPSVAALHEALSISRREYIAAKMLERLKQSLLAPASLTQLDMSILYLTFPYFTRSDHRNEARFLIENAFSIRLVTHSSVEEMEAITNSLLQLEFKGDIGIWSSYFSKYGDAVLNTCFAGLVECSLTDFFNFLQPLKYTPFLENLIVAYLTTRLFELYPRDLLAEKLEEFLSFAPAGFGTHLRDAAMAAGIPVNKTTGTPPALLPVPILKHSRSLTEFVASLDHNAEPTDAEVIGRTMVQLCGYDPGSDEFRGLVARCVEKNPLAGGYFLRGAALAVRESLRRDKSFSGALEMALNNVKQRYELGRAFELIDRQARNQELGTVTFHASQYHEDRMFAALLHEFAPSDGVLKVESGREWGTSSSATNTIRLECNIMTHEQSRERADLLFNFRGFHIFGRPDWIRELSREPPSSIPISVHDYINGLIKSDFDITETDKQFNGSGHAIRAWLSFHGGVMSTAGPQQGELVEGTLYDAARIIGSVGTALRRRRRGVPTDEIFENFLKGTSDVVLLGAIHSNLIQKWWIGDLQNSATSFLLFGPRDFDYTMSAQGGKVFANIVAFSGTVSQFRAAPIRTEVIELFRSVAAILKDVSEIEFSKTEIRELLARFLFDAISPDVRIKNRNLWAFAVTPDDAVELLRMDQFDMAAA
jgi:hypothetical protein